MNSQNLDFSFYLSLFCCLHLWLLCLFLAAKKNKGITDYFLSAFLFCFSTIHLQHILLQTGYICYVPFLDPVMGIILSLVGPLFYFYVRSMTGEKKLVQKFKVHLVVLIPATIHLCYLLITKRGIQLYDYYYKTNADAAQYTLTNVLLLLAMLGYLFFYLTGSILVLNRHARRIKEVYSNIEKIQLNWLRDLIIILMVFACIIAPTTILVADTRISQLSMGYFSTFIYFIIVYKSLNYSVVFSPAIQFAGQDTHPPALSNIEETVPAAERYTKSTLSNEQVEEYGHSVEIFLVSNHLLYDQDLSLKQMAGALNMPPHTLSQVINRYYNKSFFELINSFRIEHAKKQLAQITKLNYTIEGIGYSCGFGSKTAFYRAFKKYTGLTPTEYNAHQAAQ